MKTANQIGELLLAVMVITIGYLTAFSAAADSTPAPHPALLLQMAPTFLSAHQWLEIFSKFSSSASLSAIPNFECEAESGFWHSFRTNGRQGGDYPDHFLSDNDALVPDNDHVLDYNDHFLPYLDPDPHS